MSQDSRNAVSDAINWRQSAKLGGGAWVACYALLLVVMQVAGSFDDLPSETSKTDAVFQVLYSGSFGTFVPTDGGSTEAVRASQWAANTEDPLMILAVALQYLLPAVALLAAGFLLARTDHDVTRSIGMISGASAVVGFGILTVLATAVFSAPDGMTTGSLGLLTAAILVPVAFGALGGMATAGLRIRPTSSDLYGVGGFLGGAITWYLLAETADGEVLSNVYEFQELQEVFIFGVTYGLQHGVLDALWENSPEYTLGWLTVVVPLGAGYLLVSRTADSSDEIEGLSDGTRLALGYGAIVGVVLLAELGFAADEFGVDNPTRIAKYAVEFSLPTLLFAGIVWPLALGAAGGAVAALLN